MEELKKTPITSTLLVLNILFFLFSEFTGGSEDILHMIKIGASCVEKTVYEREYYRLFTSMFLHFGMQHLAYNMLILFAMGSRLEPIVGKIRFLMIYLLGGLIGNIISIYCAYRMYEKSVFAGASGAIFAILGGLLFIVLINRGRAADLSLRQMLIAAAMAIFLGFTSSGVDNIAHVGGMLGGLVICAVVYPRRRN